MTRRFFDALDGALAATGMTVAELCRRADVSDDQINKLLQRGRAGKKATTNVDDAVKIANALGLTLDELLQDDTAILRSDGVRLWQRLSDAEREILLAAARGQRDAPDPAP